MSGQFKAKNWRPESGGSHGGTEAWRLAVQKAGRERARKRNGPARTRRLPKGSYVYAWFNSDSGLPFYIGRGQGRRAWDRHCDEGGRAGACQTARSASPGFRVVIVRDNLTQEGAILLEACLISFARLLGAPLTNQVAGTSRQEIPPLELAAPQDRHQGPQDAIPDPPAEEASTQPVGKTTPQNANAGLRDSGLPCGESS